MRLQESSVGCSIFRDRGPIKNGGVAQLGEHLPCKQGVKGSIPFISTNRRCRYPLIKQSKAKSRASRNEWMRKIITTVKSRETRNTE